MELSDPTIPEMRDHLLADRPCPQYQRLALVQLSENALRQFHASGSHRHRPCAKFRFRSHALPDFQGALEQSIQYRPGRAMFVREAIRFPYLAQDLRFAQQHGIKSCRNSKEMP